MPKSTSTLIRISFSEAPGAVVDHYTFRPSRPPTRDNVTYYSRAAMPTTNRNGPFASVPITPAPHTDTLRTSDSGKWRVKRVVHHRGKITYRTKLQFRVQWKPRDRKVSPDTWIPWN